MTRIHTNVISLAARQNLRANGERLLVAVQRLSTGLKINSGVDDPAGLIASSVLGSEAVAIGLAIDDSRRAADVISTTDAVLVQVGNLLNDISGLVAASASKGVLSQSEVDANQARLDSALDTIDRIGKTTTFDGQRLFGSGVVSAVGSLLPLFSSSADIQVNSFNPSLLGDLSADAVQVEVTQAASPARLTITGFSNINGVGINHLTVGSATHGTTTLQGIGVNGYNGAAKSIAALTTPGGTNGTAATTSLIDLSNAAFTGLAAGGTTILTLANNDFAAGAASATISLANSSLNTGGNSAAQYLATQINNVATKTGIFAVASGRKVHISSLKIGADTASISLDSPGLSALTTTGNGGSVTVIAGSPVSGSGNLTTLAITGSKNAGQPAYVTFDNTAAIDDSSQLVDAINSVQSVTGVTASLGVDGIAGSSLGASVILTDSGYGAGSQVTVTALAAGVANSNTTQSADATTINNSETTVAGSGTSNTTTLELTGDLGSATITVDNSDVVNDSGALTTAINSVTTQTGITASGGGPGGNVVLTSQDLGPSAKLGLQAISATNSADITLFNSPDTQQTALGSDQQVTVSDAQGSSVFTSRQIDFSDALISFTATLAADSLQAGAAASFGLQSNVNFQIGSQVNRANQLAAILPALDTNLLGRDSTTTGDLSLHDLHTGGSQTLSGTDLTQAAQVVAQAIDQVATMRGELGATQDALESNINSQQTELEQVTAANSNIRDADVAVETARLVQNQVLVKVGTSILALANAMPQQVLALLKRY